MLFCALNAVKGMVIKMKRKKMKRKIGALLVGAAMIFQTAAAVSVMAEEDEYILKNAHNIELKLSGDENATTGEYFKGLAVMQNGTRTYLYAGKENSNNDGGIYVYDVTDPSKAEFIAKENNIGNVSPITFQMNGRLAGIKDKNTNYLMFYVNDNGYWFCPTNADGTADGNKCIKFSELKNWNSDIKVCGKYVAVSGTSSFDVYKIEDGNLKKISETSVTDNSEIQAIDIRDDGSEFSAVVVKKDGSKGKSISIYKANPNDMVFQFKAEKNIDDLIENADVREVAFVDKDIAVVAGDQYQGVSVARYTDGAIVTEKKVGIGVGSVSALDNGYYAIGGREWVGICKTDSNAPQQINNTNAFNEEIEALNGRVYSLGWGGILTVADYKTANNTYSDFMSVLNPKFVSNAPLKIAEGENAAVGNYQKSLAVTKIGDKTFAYAGKENTDSDGDGIGDGGIYAYDITDMNNVRFVAKYDCLGGVSTNHIPLNKKLEILSDNTGKYLAYWRNGAVSYAPISADGTLDSMRCNSIDGIDAVWYTRIVSAENYVALNDDTSVHVYKFENGTATKCGNFTIPSDDAAAGYKIENIGIGINDGILSIAVGERISDGTKSNKVVLYNGELSEKLSFKINNEINITDKIKNDGRDAVDTDVCDIELVDSDTVAAVYAQRGAYIIDFSTGTPTVSNVNTKWCQSVCATGDGRFVISAGGELNYYKKNENNNQQLGYIIPADTDGKFKGTNWDYDTSDGMLYSLAEDGYIQQFSYAVTAVCSEAVDKNGTISGNIYGWVSGDRAKIMINGIENELTVNSDGSFTYQVPISDEYKEFNAVVSIIRDNKLIALKNLTSVYSTNKIVVGDAKDADGNIAESFKNGKMSLDVTVYSSDKATKKVILAIYEGKMLTDVKIKEINSTVNELTFDFNVGNAAETTGKVMCWENDMHTPVCEPNCLENLIVPVNFR